MVLLMLFKLLQFGHILEALVSDWETNAKYGKFLEIHRSPSGFLSKSRTAFSIIGSAMSFSFATTALLTPPP